MQQPVVTNPSDGVTHGGNQFKVNEYGVILGNVGTGGSVDVRLASCSHPSTQAICMLSGTHCLPAMPSPC